MTERDWEAEATQQGWKPEDQWTDPNKPWIDAKTFVEKGEKIAGIARSRADRERAHFENRIAKLEKANRDFGEYQKNLRENDRAKSAARIAELEAQLAAAVNDGDGQAFTKVSREIEQERSNMSPPPPVNGEQENPLAEAWLINNDWYNTNPKLKTYADGVADAVEREGYTGQAYFNEITRRVRTDFPEEFDNKKKSGANEVESGGEKTITDRSAHTYENLDPEAKAACDMYVAEGLLTKEEFVKDYEWGKEDFPWNQ